MTHLLTNFLLAYPDVVRDATTGVIRTVHSDQKVQVDSQHRRRFNLIVVHRLQT